MIDLPPPEEPRPEPVEGRSLEPVEERRPEPFEGRRSEPIEGSSVPSTSAIPHNREAEEAVVGAVLINPEAYYDLAQFLQADDFYIHRHRWIWEAFTRLHEKRHLVYVGTGENTSAPATDTRPLPHSPEDSEEGLDVFEDFLKKLKDDPGEEEEKPKPE